MAVIKMTMKGYGFHWPYHLHANFPASLLDDLVPLLRQL